MSLEVLVSIGLAVEGLQFCALGWGLVKLIAIERELGSIQARIKSLENGLHRLA